MRSLVSLCLRKKKNNTTFELIDRSFVFYGGSVVVLKSALTQHLADVGLDVHVLEVLEGVGMEQPEGGVQSDGHPDPVPVPGQLTHLAVLTGVGVKRFLKGTKNIQIKKTERRIS